MTTFSPAPTSLRIPLPSGPAIFHALSTDHYPWAELTAELDSRREQGFTGVLDVQQGGRWARFLLGPEQLRGFTTGGQAVSLAAAMRAMPRAQVTLTPLDAGVCDLVWAFRVGNPAPRTLLWPGARQTLETSLFTGALIAPSGRSYWRAGQVLAGSLPALGEACAALEPDQEFDRGGTLLFWQEVMGVLARHTDLNALWSQARVVLTDAHPCLDPFTQEVVWEAETLRVDDALSVTELNAAMTAGVKLIAQRGAVRLADLPLNHLARRPEWHALFGRPA